MLRSTSVKKESWKPVKLLAKQPVKDSILSLDSDSGGKIAVALTKTSVNIFNNRELLKIIEIKGGKKLKISSIAENIFVLSSEKLQCFDYWGNLKWDYVSEGLIDDFSIDNSGKRIVLRGEKFLIFLNRYGDFEWDYTFEESILAIFQNIGGDLLVSTTKGIFLLESENNFIMLLEIPNQISTYFSEEGGITTTDTELISFSLTGYIFWQIFLSEVNIIKYSNKSQKNYIIFEGKNLTCQDRNSDEIWRYSSEDDLEGLKVLESGTMIGLYSSSYFHILDEFGDQAWSYNAREKIVDFSFSSYGGDVIIASEYKLHWFQNEGFLRNQISSSMQVIEELMTKASVYESNMGEVEDKLNLVQDQSGGNFQSLKQSFSIILDLRTRLELLQERHVNYLDSLPNFMKSLGLEGAQTDEMVPLIYPYYSLFGDIDDDTSYINLLEFATHLLLKLDRYDLTKIKNDGIFDQKNFIIEAKKGIKDEMSAIQQLIDDSKKDIEKLEVDVKNLIFDWLKSGNINSDIQDFFYDYTDHISKRFLKKEIIVDKIESHMAFVIYSNRDILLLSSSMFRCRDEVELRLNVLNSSDNKLDKISVRAKIEGEGLILSYPPSGVVRINHLESNESAPIVFSFSAKSRANTRVILISEYIDDIGRKCTDWLGDVQTNFLGCYVKPLKLSEQEHDDYRLSFNENTSHSSLNIEGLQVGKIAKIVKEMPGLYLCNLKEEDNRSIIYHSGESSLDGSKYLSMIFVRKVGEAESLRVALELICHATYMDNSSELKEEILSYIKNKLLVLNAKFV